MADLGLMRLRTLAQYAAALPVCHGLPLASSFKINEIQSLADWTILLRREPGSDDYTYCQYGEGIADHYGQDMTGRAVSDLSGHISIFIAALYQAAIIRRESVLSEHEAPSVAFVHSWRRLIIPLAEADGTINSFAVGNIPDSPLRAGLDIVPDPAFVFDQNQLLRFANSAACRLFPWVLDARQVNLRQFFGKSIQELIDRARKNDGTHTFRRNVNLPSLPRRQFELTAGITLHAQQQVCIITLRDITKQFQAVRKIRRLAETDVLTNLANRHMFDRTLARMAGAGQPPFALFLIDLNNFKSVNDRYGHPIGDALLRAVGQRLKRRCRESECVARIGGDEFAILLPKITSQEQAQKRSLQLLQSFDEPFHLDEHTIRASASVGWSIHDGTGRPSQILMQTADRALYRMKGTIH